MNMKRDKKVHIYRKKRKNVPENKIIEEITSKYQHIDAAKIKNFSDFPLSSKTLMGLKDSDYTEPTDIQKQSISLALRGHDILGAAKTGSGKTLAFLIPILEILYCKQWTQLDGIGALIITPTRELAYQIYETLRKVGRHHDVSAGLIIGGKDLKFEKKRMDRCNIIICTPGRLLQHMDENPLFDCVTLKILVLDEADRCLDMGFEKTMNSIIENLPPDRQTLLFSATQTKSVKDLARLSLTDPIYMSVHEHATHSTPEALQQSYIVCNLEEKMSMLWSFIRSHLKQKIIVFFNSCKQAKYINEAFRRMRPGVTLLALYGTLSQKVRMDIYDSFCKKQHAVLFATDIVARGIDFPEVDWVLQMDCPENVKEYIHRAGRTARFHRGGESLLVLLPSEIKMVDKLQEHKIPICSIKINPNKLQSPQRKLEALLARDVTLKESAQRAVVAYVKSVHFMTDKEIFNVNALNIEAYAKSLGLALPPRIRFLNRLQNSSKTNNNANVNSEKCDLSHSKLRQLDKYEKESSSNEDEKNDEDIDKKYIERTCITEGHSDESDEEFLTVKKKNVQLEDEELTETQQEETSKIKSKKAITKAAVAKKILKKKIVANKKMNFDEDGKEVIDYTKSKVSELGRQYEQESTPGIDIEMAKQVLREEDQFDKQRYREKIKEKHREEKKKLKKKKQKFDEDENQTTIGENSDSDDGPDLSWLPDPDKIYGKENTEESDGSIEGNSEIELNDNIHRPSKRKLATQEKNKKRKRSLSPTFNNDLKTDEELALQLLKSY